MLKVQLCAAAKKVGIEQDLTKFLFLQVAVA